MNNPPGLGRYLSGLNAQLDSQVTGGSVDRVPARRAVTISRQAGCGASAIAEKLAARLEQTSPAGEPPWTIFDRQLLEAILADPDLTARIAELLPAGRIKELQRSVVDLFGPRPASGTLIRQTSELILQLADLGHAILIGRGGNVITARLPHAVHVRLVAPLASRIAYAARTCGTSQRAARDFCRREDLGRGRYLRKHLKAEIADPALYHLCLNTDRVTPEEAARSIADIVRGRTPPAPSVDSRSGMTDASAACAHRAELQFTQLERL